MNSIGYNNYYENQDIVNLGADENEIVCRMANSKIMVIRTHGSQTSITTTGGSLTRDEINNLQANIFSYSEIIVFGACRTGEGREGADNLVNATHNHGCEIVIGFEESVWASEVNEWCKQFFKYIALGHSIIDACYAADFYIAYVWLQDHPGIDIRTDSWYIAGNEDKYF